MYLLTTGTHRSDPPMAMYRRTGTAHTPATRATGTITTAMWLMTEDMQHPEIPTFRKVQKRREIETTNPLEISTQVS